jgi:transcription termination factor Rho
MSVLDPRELEASPLADLHALAAELGLEGFRRLRKEELIKQIVAVQGGEVPSDSGDDDGDDPEVALYEDAAAERDDDQGDRDVRPGQVEGDDEDLHEGSTAEVPRDYQEPMPNWERQKADAKDDDGDDGGEEEREEDMRTGILDVLPNGSGFIRAEPYRQSREDVYVSPAQIRRCELRPGDDVAGPVRPPRRNERHPSLVRVATVNGTDADTPAERPRFESLTAAWPTERLAGPNALSDLPFGKGSRVAIGGPPGAGASRILREAVQVLRERHSDVDVIVVLAGVRPEEIAEWSDTGAEVAGGGFDGSFEEQSQVAELAVQRAKRSVESGRDVVVVVDSLDALPPAAARRVFGAGRNAVDGGSLTILASTGTSAEPHRMATTHVTLETPEAGEPRVGAGSGTLRRDLLG